MKHFKINQRLSSGSHRTNIDTAIVTKITDKTITIKKDDGTSKRCKIHTRGEGDFIYPDGQYWMCDVFRA